MGVVEKGSISGVLPSNNDVLAVHFPGYPSSVDRAIDSLGGSNGTVKIPTDKSRRLELRLRPEDPDCHPLFGDLQSCDNFLLKISKKKVKNKECSTTECAVGLEPELISTSLETESQKKDESVYQLSVDIVSRVSGAYHFDGMADYQYVPALHADSIRKKKRDWFYNGTPTENSDIFDMVQEDLMLLVPPLFSVKDRPEKLILKPCGDPTSKKKPDEVVEPIAEASEPTAKKRKIEPCLAIKFNIKEIPKEVDWKEFIPKDSEKWQWQKAVCDLFSERPIWVKRSIAERLHDQGLNITDKILRRLLFLAAYYFSNGPYLRFWIRKGYDPRKDPESRIYQRTDFRVPPSLTSYTDSAPGVSDRWDDICAFRVVPHKCQTSLQLIELQDDYIQQEIQKPASQQTCSLQTGWFSSQAINSMRLRVAQRYLSIFPGEGVESLLKNVTIRFERSKRAHLKIPKVDGKKKEPDSAPVVEDVNKETNAEVEEMENEEDYEDGLFMTENLEEEEDEELDLVDEDGDTLPYPYMDENENVAKDYLQDLFGSYSFGAAGQDDKQDEGEYQIYEQSDDEDELDY